jgi:hypothetical protein
MNTVEFLKEAQLIVTGKHSAYRAFSDRINNYETFIWTFAKDNPKQALAIADEIYADINAAVEAGNMTPHRTEQTALLLKRTAEKYAVKKESNNAEQTTVERTYLTPEQQAVVESRIARGYQYDKKKNGNYVVWKGKHIMEINCLGYDCHIANWQRP